MLNNLFILDISLLHWSSLIRLVELILKLALADIKLVK